MIDKGEYISYSYYLASCGCLVRQPINVKVENWKLSRYRSRELELLRDAVDEASIQITEERARESVTALLTSRAPTISGGRRIIASCLACPR